MLETKPAPTTHAAPARRWRNYYRVYHVLSLYRLGTIFPGVHGGPDVFPSKEIAEERAHSFIRAINPPGRYLMEFAGAFPEGDAAN